MSSFPDPLLSGTPAEFLRTLKEPQYYLLSEFNMNNMVRLLIFNKIIVVTGESPKAADDFANKLAKYLDFLEDNVVYVNASNHNTTLHDLKMLTEKHGISTANKTVKEYITDLVDHLKPRFTLFIYFNAKNDNELVKMLGNSFENNHLVLNLITSKDSEWDFNRYKMLNIEKCKGNDLNFVKILNYHQEPREIFDINSNSLFELKKKMSLSFLNKDEPRRKKGKGRHKKCEEEEGSRRKHRKKIKKHKEAAPKEDIMNRDYTVKTLIFGLKLESPTEKLGNEIEDKNTGDAKREVKRKTSSDENVMFEVNVKKNQKGRPGANTSREETSAVPNFKPGAIKVALEAAKARVETSVVEDRNFSTTRPIQVRRKIPDKSSPTNEATSKSDILKVFNKMKAIKKEVEKNLTISQSLDQNLVKRKDSVSELKSIIRKLDLSSTEKYISMPEEEKNVEVKEKASESDIEEIFKKISEAEPVESQKYQYDLLKKQIEDLSRQIGSRSLPDLKISELFKKIKFDRALLPDPAPKVYGPMTQAEYTQMMLRKAEKIISTLLKTRTPSEIDRLSKVLPENYKLGQEGRKKTGTEPTPAPFNQTTPSKKHPRALKLKIRKSATTNANPSVVSVPMFKTMM